MTAYALVTGTLFRAPEPRASKSGKPFVTATLKAKDGDALQWWRVVAFSEIAQSALQRLGDGDAVTCQGPLKVESYEKDGETKLSLSLVADHVLALRQAPKPREKSSPSEQPARVNRDFDDPLPY
jgi:single-stranded DNA-binding protein